MWRTRIFLTLHFTYKIVSWTGSRRLSHRLVSCTAESIPIYPAEADTDRAPYGVLLKWTRQKSASAESKSSDETPVDVVPTKTEHSESLYCILYVDARRQASDDG